MKESKVYYNLLTPLSFLKRSVAVYPDKEALSTENNATPTKSLTPGQQAGQCIKQFGSGAR
jgi:hypothetical protein